MSAILKFDFEKWKQLYFQKKSILTTPPHPTPTPTYTQTQRKKERKEHGMWQLHFSYSANKSKQLVDPSLCP